jgi:hypothetical protein
MKIGFLSVLLFCVIHVAAQVAGSGFQWWNDVHNWQPGDPNWRSMMDISPGYLGPNALPVPDVKKGWLQSTTEIEITASSHFHKEDPTRDISGRIYIPFAKNKIAFEMYGVALEHYAYSERIRNERFSRDEDGKGIATGDFYFSTLIQVFRDRKFPNTVFRIAGKTASGFQDAARYTDSPGYFFDLSFSKDISLTGAHTFRPFGLVGFYCWQTYDEGTPQNDAFMYALGADFEKNNWLCSASWSGYSGYKNDGDKPMQLNFDIRKDFSHCAIRIQYLHGLRDWNYQTVRFSYIRKLNPVQ